ncbi:hypothetical protein EBZ39_17505, partial [bacterium]|nr:hypothetical protein [bacterium]
PRDRVAVVPPVPTIESATPAAEAMGPLVQSWTGFPEMTGAEGVLPGAAATKRVEVGVVFVTHGRRDIYTGGADFISPS